MSHVYNYIFYIFPLESRLVQYSWPHALFKGRMLFIRWTNENNAAIITDWLHSILVASFPILISRTSAIPTTKYIV